MWAQLRPPPALFGVLVVLQKVLQPSALSHLSAFCAIMTLFVAVVIVIVPAAALAPVSGVAVFLLVRVWFSYHRYSILLLHPVCTNPIKVFLKSPR